MLHRLEVVFKTLIQSICPYYPFCRSFKDEFSPTDKVCLCARISGIKKLPDHLASKSHRISKYIPSMGAMASSLRDLV